MAQSPLSETLGVPLTQIPLHPDALRDWPVDPSPPPESLTISSVVNCIYASFSGANALAENRERILRLCAPMARVMIAQRAENGVARPQVMSMVEYLDDLKSRFPGSDLHAFEIGRRSIRFGSIGNVFTGWRSVRSDDRQKVACGLTSMQLFFDSRRWWLVSYLSDLVEDEAKLRTLLNTPFAHEPIHHPAH